MDGYDEATYGDRFADVYDEWFTEIGDLETCVEFLAELACGASTNPILLELGIGTGRIALPLAQRGLDVRGIDSSAAMVAALHDKPGAHQIATAVASMTEVTIPARSADEDEVNADLVFVAYNTFFNLPDREAQAQCIERVAKVLAPNGRFVIEAFVPDLTVTTDNRVTVRSMSADRLVLVATLLDDEHQTIEGQYVDITEDGIKLRPWHISYLTPDQLDLLASEAGLVLEHRWASYSSERFDPLTSPQHVSVYRLGAPTAP